MGGKQWFIPESARAGGRRRCGCHCSLLNGTPAYPVLRNGLSLLVEGEAGGLTVASEAAGGGNVPHFYTLKLSKHDIGRRWNECCCR